MLCCVCLLRVQNIMEIFDEIGIKLNIAEIINKHFWFKPQPNDLETSQICTICWYKINDFDQFYKTVEKSHKQFQLDKQNLSEIKKEDKDLKNIKEEHDEEILEDNTMQIEVEQLTDNNEKVKNPLEDNQSDNEVFEIMKTQYEINKNPSEISENDSCNDEEEFNEVEHPEPKNTACTVKNKIKRPATSKLKKPEDSSDKTKSFKCLERNSTDEMIRKHIPMGCNLCVFVGATFPDIVKHFKISHPGVRPYITCCDKRFTKRYYVAQHAMTHENPNSFRCEECNKSFKTVNNLQRHNLISHAPEEKCTFECDLCPMKFARQHLLEIHKTSHLPREQWKFFCTKCPAQKAFASKRLLNMHDINIHKTAANICNVCAKEIKNKKVFEKHIRSHYEDNGPRIKCTINNCDSWLKDEDSLKKHIRDTHSTENKLFKCLDCGKDCLSKRALYGHRTYAHSNEVFKCEQCDKHFKKAISLREHMAQHTGEILYNCPFCSRTFNSNSNMHNHKKNQHPIEWEEARRKKGVGGS